MPRKQRLRNPHFLWEFVWKNKISVLFWYRKDNGAKHWPPRFTGMPSCAYSALPHCRFEPGVGSVGRVHMNPACCCKLVGPLQRDAINNHWLNPLSYCGEPLIWGEISCYKIWITYYSQNNLLELGTTGSWRCFIYCKHILIVVLVSIHFGNGDWTSLAKTDVKIKSYHNWPSFPQSTDLLRFRYYIFYNISFCKPLKLLEG